MRRLRPRSSFCNCLSVLALLILVATPTHAVQSSKPNVLFIAIDDLNNWIGALGGHPQAQTPNMDQLAHRGTLFSNAHCAAPACNPSRTSVMTGLSPTTSGVYFNWQDWRESKILKPIVTLPQHFKNHGYTVMGGGKLYHAASLTQRGHTGYLDPRPWDTYFPSKQRQLPEEVLPDVFPTHGHRKFYRGFFDWAALDITDEAMADSKVVSWAESQLAREHTKPLFLAVGLYRPHISWYTPKAYFEHFPLGNLVLPEVNETDLSDVPEAGIAMVRQNWHRWIKDNDHWPKAVQAYLASVSYADAMVGRLLKALDEGPLAENTIVVLWSDHGYHLGHKQHWEKFALWEQTTRVPLILAIPGDSPGQEVKAPVSLLDLYPTLVDLCTLSPPTHLEGTSLRAWLENSNRVSERMVCTTQGPGNHAMRSQHWRYVRYADGSEELYDHRIDSQETTNLASHPEHITELKRHRARLPKSNAPLEPSKLTRFRTP